LESALKEGVLENLHVPARYSEKLEILIVKRLRSWAGRHCDHLSETSDSPVQVEAPNAEYWCQFGLRKVDGTWCCEPCNFRFERGQDKVYMLERHVVSDPHDSSAAARRHKYALAGGWAAREAWRDVQRKEEAERSKVAKGIPKEKVSKEACGVKRKAWTTERTRRVSDLRNLQPAPMDLAAKPQQDCTSTKTQDTRKASLNMSFIKAWLAANLPLNAVDALHEWLCSHLIDGSLLHHTSWLRKHYVPDAGTEQKEAIRNAISDSKCNGLSVLLDGSTDQEHDLKPINFLVATSSTLFYCDTAFFDPTQSESADNLVALVRSFVQDWMPGDVADHVLWLNTDNHSTMESLCKKLISCLVFPFAT